MKLIAFSSALLLLILRASAESSWPQFRGPGGLGVADHGDPPIHFGPNSNVIWQTTLPEGKSSPCVWGERIFLTVFDKTKLETLCLDRYDGKVLWRHAAPSEQFEPAHRLGSPATPTPATDGQRVYVYFGSFGLIAYDFAGREQWRKPLPTPMVEFGNSASPVLAGDLLILVCDQDQASYLLALDRHTGQTVWRTERPAFRRSFATPFVWRHDGAEELIVPGSIWLKSYDLKDGTERWTYSGTSRVACSSPTAGDGLLFSASWNVGGDPDSRISMPPFDEFAREHDTNGDVKIALAEIPAGPIKERFTQMDFNKDGLVTSVEWATMREMFAKAGNAVLALRPGGRGDITDTHLAWKATRSLPYVSSPLYYQNRLYTVKSGGLASCYDAKTGRALYQDERLDASGDYYSSAVAAGGRIYLASERGVMLVLAAGDTLNVLARNDLAEPIMATPAIIEDTLYVRAGNHLYAFKRQPPRP
jgi:outer membrane protein assembly factor BamB